MLKLTQYSCTLIKSGISGIFDRPSCNAKSLREIGIFREYIELKELGMHPQSGMPLTKEFRLFIKDGKIIDTFYYWDEGDYQGLQAEIKSFQAVKSDRFGSSSI